MKTEHRISKSPEIYRRVKGIPMRLLTFFSVALILAISAAAPTSSLAKTTCKTTGAITKCTIESTTPKTCYQEVATAPSLTCGGNDSRSADFANACDYKEAGTELIPYDCSTSTKTESCYTIRTESYGEHSDTYRETKVIVDCNAPVDECQWKGNSACGGGGDSH